jgi:5'-nucleotidase (lipoprotein e(P4) family)
MKLKFYLFLLPAFVLSCNQNNKNNQEIKQNNDRLLVAVAWYQHSAEMAALYYQGFNIARERLDETLKNYKKGKPPVVVVDVDETMLNNSPFETSLLTNEDSLSGWYNWTSKASAKPLPGALEFAKYAESKKVEIFYITNRDDNERASTIKNLASAGFPFADEVHLLTKSDLSYAAGNTSSKAGRRARVAENHEIILLIGDNLNDFDEKFEDRSRNNGRDSVLKYSSEFGKKFIVLPNPIYGAWEKPLYNYIDTLTNAQKASLMKEKLIRE